MHFASDGTGRSSDLFMDTAEIQSHKDLNLNLYDPKTHTHSILARCPIKDRSPVLPFLLLISKKSSRHRRRKLASALAKPPEIAGVLVGLQGRGSPGPPRSLKCVKCVEQRLLMLSSWCSVSCPHACLILMPLYVLCCPNKSECSFTGPGSWPCQ